MFQSGFVLLHVCVCTNHTQCWFVRSDIKDVDSIDRFVTCFSLYFFFNLSVSHALVDLVEQLSSVHLYEYTILFLSVPPVGRHVDYTSFFLLNIVSALNIPCSYF